MKEEIKVIVFIVFMLFIPTVAIQADDSRAREIMQKAKNRENGDNVITDMEMVLIDKRGKQRMKEIRSFSKDKGNDSYRIMFFLYPADVKGTGFLTYDYKDKDDDQWLYLPALRKTKRIPPSEKSGSFMGSDFNHSDMSSGNMDDYDYELLKEVDVNGVKTWLIQSVPRSQKVINETGYSKSLLFVRQDNYIIIRAVRWVNESSKLKYMDVKKLECIEGIWVATEIHMTTKEGKKVLHKTILRENDVRFNQDLPDTLFTVHQLEKGL